MRLFGRRRPDPLGDGVWRRAHDRFRRAVDRYHQVIEGVPDGELRDALELLGARLAACLDAVRAACERAQAEHPSEGLDIPGAARDLHARLSRGATLAAQAAEAATMARLRAASTPGTAQDARQALAAQRAVEQVERLVSG